MANTYIPRHQNQHAHNGFPHPLPAWYVNQGWPYDDCWVHVVSWQIDGYTGGKTIPTAPEIRARVHKLDLPVAVNGPGGADDVANALKAYQVPFLPHDTGYIQPIPINDLKTMLEEPSGKYVWIGTNFSKWPVHNCDRGFNGKHAVGAICGANSANKIKIMDPICDDYYWVNIDKVLKSAEYYAGHDHGHPGHAYAIYTVGTGADPCPPGKVRNQQGDCVDPPPPNNNDAEPWYNQQANIETAGASIGASTTITVVLIVIAVVVIGGAYVAFKSGSKVMPVVDRGT